MVWTEKWRPNKIEDLIIENDLKSLLKKDLNQNLLFYSSSPGTGKTSIIKILISDLNYLWINCSRENGVDLLRNKINKFCSVFDPLSEKKKVVVLDEVDGASPEFFAAARGVIEEFHENIVFLATCNFFNKIPDAFASRFKTKDLTDISDSKFIRNEYYKRILKICSDENIKIDKDSAVWLINKNFPDLRTIIQELQFQKDSNQTEITLESLKLNKVHNNKEFFDILNEQIHAKKINTIKCYNWVKSKYKNINSTKDFFSFLNNDFIQWCELNNKTDNLHKIVFSIWKYQITIDQVIDPFITCVSVIIEIIEILKKVK